jgi:hypothetical protein
LFKVLLFQFFIQPKCQDSQQGKSAIEIEMLMPVHIFNNAPASARPIGPEIQHEPDIDRKSAHQNQEAE